MTAIVLPPDAVLIQTTEGRGKSNSVRWTELYKVAGGFVTCTRSRTGEVSDVEYHSKRPRI